MTEKLIQWTQIAANVSTCALGLMGLIATIIFGVWAHQDSSADLALQLKLEEEKRMISVVPDHSVYAIEWNSETKTFKTNDAAFFALVNQSEHSITDVVMNWKFYADEVFALGTFDERYSFRNSPTPTIATANGTMKVISIPPRFSSLFDEQELFVPELADGELSIAAIDKRGQTFVTHFRFHAHKDKKGRLCLHFARDWSITSSGIFGMTSLINL